MGDAPDYLEPEPLGRFSMIPEWIIDAGISSHAVRLYVTLWRYADNETRTGYPARSTIAARMGISEKTVDRARAELVRIGALRVSHRADERGQTSNLYRMLWRPPPRLPLGTGDEGSLDAGVARNENHDERESDRAPATKRKRRRTPNDDLFDALVEAFGAATTKSRAAFYGKAVRELSEAGATAEQIANAAAEMRHRDWRDATPEAMLKHWDDLVAAPKASRRRRDPSQVIHNPGQWRVDDPEWMALYAPGGFHDGGPEPA